MDEAPPQPLDAQGALVAPAKCVICRETEMDVHRLEWAPHLPPFADGRQRGVHIHCMTAVTGRKIGIPRDVAREVERVANNA